MGVFQGLFKTGKKKGDEQEQEKNTAMSKQAGAGGQEEEEYYEEEVVISDVEDMEDDYEEEIIDDEGEFYEEEVVISSPEASPEVTTRKASNTSMANPKAKPVTIPKKPTKPATVATTTTKKPAPKPTKPKKKTTKSNDDDAFKDMTPDEKRQAQEQLRKVKEEADKLQREIQQQRLLKQKELLGGGNVEAANEVEHIKDRKTHIKTAQEEYAALTNLRNLELDRENALSKASAIQERKKQLQQDTERIAIKGKHLDGNDDPTSPVKALDKSKLEKDTSKVPSLFSAQAHPRVSPSGGSGASKAAASTPPVASSTSDGPEPTPKNWDGKYYTLVDIRQRRVPNVDLHNRELYLSPEEFYKTFKMSKVEFQKQPKWKRDKLKSAIHIF